MKIVKEFETTTDNFSYVNKSKGNYLFTGMYYHVTYLKVFDLNKLPLDVLKRYQSYCPPFSLGENILYSDLDMGNYINGYIFENYKAQEMKSLTNNLAIFNDKLIDYPNIIKVLNFIKNRIDKKTILRIKIPTINSFFVDFIYFFSAFFNNIKLTKENEWIRDNFEVEFTNLKNLNIINHINDLIERIGNNEPKSFIYLLEDGMFINNINDFTTKVISEVNRNISLIDMSNALKNYNNIYEKELMEKGLVKMKI